MKQEINPVVEKLPNKRPDDFAYSWAYEIYSHIFDKAIKEIEPKEDIRPKLNRIM